MIYRPAYVISGYICTQIFTASDLYIVPPLESFSDLSKKMQATGNDEKNNPTLLFLLTFLFGIQQFSGQKSLQIGIKMVLKHVILHYPGL